MERRHFLLVALASMATACKNRITGTAPPPPTESCPTSGPVTYTRGGDCITAPAEWSPTESAPLPAQQPQSGDGPTATALAGFKLTLDVGHGSSPSGWDPGAVSAAKGLTEYELNLTEALMVAELMRTKGAQVKVNDYRRGSAGLTLKQRGNAAGGANIFVSIHHNSAGNASAQGSEVLYERRGSYSDRALAAEIQKRLAAKVWQGNTSRNRGTKVRTLGVLEGVPKTVQASCLTEAFFISASDANKTSAEKWVKDAAAAIAEGVESYWLEKQLSLSLFGEDENDWPAEPFPEDPDPEGLYKDH